MLGHRDRSTGAPLEFVLWTRVESDGAGKFVARVSAIPRGVDERCAPEERSITCACGEEAQRAARRLARRLAYDIRRRGNRVALNPREEIPS